MFPWLAQKSLASITSNLRILTIITACQYCAVHWFAAVVQSCVMGMSGGPYISEVNRQHRQSTDSSLIYILLSTGSNRQANKG